MVRADAERNIASILDAGRRLLSVDHAASVAEIAKAAGVGRVTLYGHFPTREQLVEAILDHAVEQADHLLDDPELARLPAAQALTRLVGTSWEVLEQHGSLFVVADRMLPTERIRASHAKPLRRVEQIIQRGRDDGDFRTDLPLTWLVSTFFAILHTAAGEVEAGRLDRAAAGGTLQRTLASLLAAPAV
ncbi:TetR/AcrR family transcriptional regulator [Nonomuraea sp. NPDC050536]|uniref:TetR/AcrR family transcriptional regulator n=1 Tax=Nonomuraea sp. NPDC050536 TaxID=3364366 RepID=UPI0037C54BD7